MEGTITHKQPKMVKAFTCLEVDLEAKTVKRLNITAFKLNKNKEILKWTHPNLNQATCPFLETKVLLH